MMSDIGDEYAELAERSKKKRSNNRNGSAQLLTNKEIPFESKNSGAHLIVEGSECFIDFWPGTGKWISRDGAKGFGVRNLITHIIGFIPKDKNL